VEPDPTHSRIAKFIGDGAWTCSILAMLFIRDPLAGLMKPFWGELERTIAEMF
jgi:hypothetical protein